MAKGTSSGFKPDQGFGNSSSLPVAARTFLFNISAVEKGWSFHAQRRGPNGEYDAVANRGKAIGGRNLKV